MIYNILFKSRSFGLTLKHAIEHKNFNQSELSRLLDVNRSMISNYINDRSQPNVINLKVIESALDLRFDIEKDSNDLTIWVLKEYAPAYNRDKEYFYQRIGAYSQGDTYSLVTIHEIKELLDEYFEVIHREDSTNLFGFVIKEMEQVYSVLLGMQYSIDHIYRDFGVSNTIKLLISLNEDLDNYDHIVNLKDYNPTKNEN